MPRDVHHDECASPLDDSHDICPLRPGSYCVGVRVVGDADADAAPKHQETPQ